jgi:hypothetical protein
VVVAEEMEAGVAKQVQDIAVRTGKVLFLTQFSYSAPVGAMDLIVSKWWVMQTSGSSWE